MDILNQINQKVDVIVSYKTQANNRSACFPHKMRWKNQTIVFKELGLRHPTLKGQRMIHVFDMSDGTVDYRLEFDAELLSWTLIETLNS